MSSRGRDHDCQPSGEDTKHRQSISVVIIRSSEHRTRTRGRNNEGSKEQVSSIGDQWVLELLERAVHWVGEAVLGDKGGQRERGTFDTRDPEVARDACQGAVWDGLANAVLVSITFCERPPQEQRLQMDAYDPRPTAQMFPLEDGGTSPVIRGLMTVTELTINST
ncbi:hypothetical protein BT63DRAFT_162834 [Microthyrium microscopicum]|uniref:Uncharacterized protein n=1 Tax=Microthyrium microscopicum TaxID=703497 RepID=A0A6A6UPF5_9PEZI|nr:hypothetical protein BT63DRAFT_162834 [Microthyrium microscopicum]